MDGWDGWDLSQTTTTIRAPLAVLINEKQEFLLDPGTYLIFVTSTTSGAGGEKICHVEKFFHVTDCHVEKCLYMTNVQLEICLHMVNKEKNHVMWRNVK